MKLIVNSKLRICNKFFRNDKSQTSTSVDTSPLFGRNGEDKDVSLNLLIFQKRVWGCDKTDQNPNEVLLSRKEHTKHSNSRVRYLWATVHVGEGKEGKEGKERKGKEEGEGRTYPNSANQNTNPNQ